MICPFLPDDLLTELPISAHLLVEPVTTLALEKLLQDLDQRDEVEARQILGLGADGAVMRSLRRAQWGLSLWDDQGHVLAIGGLSPEGEGVVSPWLVTTCHLAAASLPTRLAYLELARAMVAALRRRFLCLVNLVTCANEAAMALLDWLGADFGPVISYGPEAVPAQHFFFDQEEAVHVY